MLALPPRERDELYQFVQNVWYEYGSAHAMGIPTPVVLSYMTDKAQSGAKLERDLIQKVAEVEYNMTLTDVSLRCARHGQWEV